jgi:phosphoenolpyruvate carboxykinase (ATP)
MISVRDLEKYGIENVQEIILIRHIILSLPKNQPGLTGLEKGVITRTGAVAVDTGIFTGRSPSDKYIVLDDTSRDTVWWKSEKAKVSDNKPISTGIWEHCRNLAAKQLSDKRLFIIDCFCGANVNSRLSVRFVVEVAWQAHFVKNMFIRPDEAELENFNPLRGSDGIKDHQSRLEETGTAFRELCFLQPDLRNGSHWRYLVRRRDEERPFLRNELLPASERLAAMHCSANVGKKEMSQYSSGFQEQARQPLPRSRQGSYRRRRAWMG